jgi:hypothetical protein
MLGDIQQVAAGGYGQNSIVTVRFQHGRAMRS